MKDNITKLSLNLLTLQDQLNNDCVGRRMIILFGRCTALFDGRIKSRFLDGDRVLMIKRDLSILLHGSSGVKPIQWQLPGAGNVSFKIFNGNNLRMETYRPKTDESFFITFSKVYLPLTYEAVEDYESASVIGHEKDLVQYLVKNPSIIEKGIQVIESEKEIDFGYIDILALDSSKNFVVVEVKRTPATPADAHQLKRYIDFFNEKGQKVRGILVATAFPNKVINYLKTFGLESREINWQDIFPTLTRPVSVSTPKKLDEFL